MSSSPWAAPHGLKPAGFAGFSLGVVIATWVVSYFSALVITTLVLQLTGNIETTSNSEPQWFVGVAALSLWGPLLLGLIFVSRRFGSGNFVSDYKLKFRAVDLLGIPIGVASQLLLVGLVTKPFQLLFPKLFSPDKISRRAQELVDNATGPWLVILIIVVVVGAPVVEELVYRGFIQTGLESRMSSRLAIVLGSVWFAGIHLQLVELPGLFAFALVLGSCFYITRRLGMSIVSHVAFNATGLIFVTVF